MEELQTRNIESKEVAYRPLSTHRCLQQSLVLIHRQAEQGEALCGSQPPGRSQVMERQEVGLLPGPVTPPGLNPACNFLQGRDINSTSAAGIQAQKGEVTCPGSHSKAESGGFPGIKGPNSFTETQNK